MAGEAQIRGPIYGATGSAAPFTAETTGSQRIADAHAHLYDLTRQGLCFSAMNTAARALTVSLTTTASLGLWNPANSGKLLVLLSTAFRWGSGTFAAGYLLHAIFPGQTATPGGTAVSVVSLLNGATGSAGKAYELATGLSTAVQVRFAANCGALTTDQSTTAFTSVNREFLDGAIIIAPGTAYGIVSVTGAGTSPTCWCEYSWAEVPYIP